MEFNLADESLQCNVLFPIANHPIHVSHVSAAPKFKLIRIQKSKLLNSKVFHLRYTNSELCFFPESFQSGGFLSVFLSKKKKKKNCKLKICLFQRKYAQNHRVLHKFQLIKPTFRYIYEYILFKNGFASLKRTHSEISVLKKRTFNGHIHVN